MHVTTVRDRIAARWSGGTVDLLERMERLRVDSGRESVRRLRKSVRLLRFLIGTWRPSGDRDARRSLRRELRELSRALAPARDAAVHELRTRELVPLVDRSRPELAKAGRAVVRRLRQRRRAATWRVLDVADELRHAGLRSRLEQCAWEARGELARPASAQGEELVRAALGEVLAAGRVLEERDREPGRHRLRKLARVPIALDSVLGGDGPGPGVAELKTLRLRLGDLHDLEDTRDRLIRFAEPELEAAAELAEYAGIPDGDRKAFFVHARRNLDERHEAWLGEIRAAWPELRGRLQAAASGA